MNRKLIIDLAKLLVFFSSIWALFMIFPIFPDKINIGISMQNEETLGEFMLDNITKDPSFNIIESDFIDSSIQVLKDLLLSNLEESNYIYNIYVFNNSMINAFALPGGNILISSGLIKFSEKPEEVAAVLAHEIGHIENKDLIYKLLKELGISLLSSNDPLVIGEISKIAGSMVFDRKQEKKADQFALNLLLKSNIDPRIIATFFRRLESEVGSYSEKAEIFMTHPHNKTRIRYALEYKIPENFEEIKIDMNWGKIKKEL